MSDAHDVKKDVRKYLLIFGALIVGTIITVAVSYVDFGSHTRNIIVGLIIATAKAFLVAGYFMHLMSERKLIYGILLVTVFFFAGLMYLTIWSMEPANMVHIKPNVP
ncbi:MAG: cytochrome C oxidase subunit IV family protein [Limisphaerales bacterium]